MVAIGHVQYLNGFENVATIFSSFFALLLVVGLCAWCCKRKRRPSIDDNASIESLLDDDSSFEAIDRDGKFFKAKRGNHLTEVGNNMSLNLKNMWDDEQSQQKGHHSPAPKKKHEPTDKKALDKTRERKNCDVNNFYVTLETQTVQPSYQDLMQPNQPQIIPDPTDSIINAECDGSDDVGTIHFNASYESKEQQLRVIIQEAEDVYRLSKHEPYITVSLDAAGESPNVSKNIHKDSVKNILQKPLIFEMVSIDDLVRKNLYLQVYNKDRFSRDLLLGQTSVSMKNVIYDRKPVYFTESLCPVYDEYTNAGKLLISTCYNPSANTLNIIVFKGQSIIPEDLKGKPNFYVKVSLYVSQERIEHKYTQTKCGSLNPTWNEALSFEVPPDKGNELSLYFAVKRPAKLVPPKFIGGVEIGPNARGTAHKQYVNMMKSPHKSIAMWHKVLK